MSKEGDDDGDAGEAKSKTVNEGRDEELSRVWG